MSEELSTGWYDRDDDDKVHFWDGSDWTESHEKPDNWSDLPEPGWYRDPDHDDRDRYWNGVQWIDEYRQSESADAGSDQQFEDAIWSTEGQPISGVGAGRYWLTERHLFFEKGALTTDSQQAPIAGVQDVDVEQSMSQKARDVADVIVHVERSSGDETIRLEDIPDFREAQKVINDTAHEARLRRQKREKTRRHKRVSEDSDAMEKLEQLGELRDDGVLTEEEFEEKKSEIMSEL